MAHAARRRWTPAEYLAMEREAAEKHVLRDGEVFAMAGASRRHNLLVAAILGELGNRLLGAPCAPYASNQRIRVPSSARYVYPDASVTCRPVHVDPDDAEPITNPRVLFEVLSETTERFDRGAKFQGYRSIASLEDVVLVSQDGVLVEQFTRQKDGSWVLRTHGPGDVVALASIGVELAVDALYRGVLDEPPEEPGTPVP